MAAIRGHSKKGYREALLRVLGDGEWHPFQQLYTLVESTIAPEEATRETAKWKTAPEDLDERVRLGKEAIMGKALVNLRVERQGFRNDRRTLKFRIRPDRMPDLSEAITATQLAFRAFRAIPSFRDWVASTGENVNPAQAFWLRVAVADEEPVAKAYEEASDGDS